MEGNLTYVLVCVELIVQAVFFNVLLKITSKHKETSNVFILVFIKLAKSRKICLIIYRSNSMCTCVPYYF